MTAFFIKWGIILAVASSLLFGAYRWAFNRGDAHGRAEVQALFDAHLADDAKAAAEAKEAQEQAEAAARAAEKEQQKRYDALAEQFEREKQESEDAYHRDVAALRAGNLKLRKQWQGCQASLPGAEDPAAEPDGLAELREEGAADLVRLNRDADTWIRDLQVALNTCLNPTGAVP